MTRFLRALERAQQEKPQDDAPAPPVNKQPVHERRASTFREDVLLGMYYALESRTAMEHCILELVAPSASAQAHRLGYEFGRVMVERLNRKVLFLDLDPSRRGARAMPDVTIQQVQATIANADPQQLVDLFGYDASGLYVAGLTDEDPRELIATIATGEFVTLLDTLKDSFDLVLLCPSPANRSAEPFALASKVNGVVLVVEAERTRWQTALAMIERLESQGGSVLGAVLNRYQHHIPDFMYQLFS